MFNNILHLYKHMATTQIKYRTLSSHPRKFSHAPSQIHLPSQN